MQKHKIFGVKNILIIPHLNIVSYSGHNCPKEQKEKWSTLVKTALKSFLSSFLVVVFDGDEAIRRGILWGFILQYLSMTGGEHCPFALSVFPNICQLLRICRKSCALLWTQISCKIKYYFYQYHYFLGRVNQLLQSKGVAALNGRIQVYSHKEQQIDFSLGKWAGASTSLHQQWGEGRKWLLKGVLCQFLVNAVHICGETLMVEQPLAADWKIGTCGGKRVKKDEYVCTLMGELFL